jgi:hypothetical protein
MFAPPDAKVVHILSTEGHLHQEVDQELASPLELGRGRIVNVCDYCDIIVVIIWQLISTEFHHNIVKDHCGINTPQYVFHCFLVIC